MSYGHEEHCLYPGYPCNCKSSSETGMRKAREYWIKEVKDLVNGVDEGYLKWLVYGPGVWTDNKKVVATFTHVIEKKPGMILVDEYEWGMRDQVQKDQAAIIQVLSAKVADLELRLTRTVDAAFCALLEMSAFLGIPGKKRKKQIDYLMENVRYCAENDLRDPERW